MKLKTIKKDLKKSNISSDQYQKLIQKDVEKVTIFLKNLVAGKVTKNLKVERGRKDFLRDLVKTANLQSKIFRREVPKLQQCNIALSSKVKELNQYQKKLERQEILEHTIINHMAESMYVTDVEGNIIIINEIAKETLGYGLSDNLIGKNVFDFIEWRDKNGHKVKKEDRPLSQVIENGGMVRVSFSDGWSGVRKNGKTFPVRIYASPVELSGKLKAMVVIFHDATKERRIDEIKSDFISIASHQLRTPLAVSTLHTEMLLAGHIGQLNKEQEEYVKEIHFYNKKMAELLNVFLSVSKIEMDTFTMELEPLSIESILDDTIHELSSDIDERRIKITKIYYKNPLPKIYADSSLLRVSLQNIISNAIKYSRVGGKIFIETKRSGGNVLVKVRDTGMGISEKDKSRVFMKLYRGKNAKKIDSIGTGLGLYIAKSFIEKNRGEIWFDSQINVGTTFFVLLPIKASPKN